MTRLFDYSGISVVEIIQSAICCRESIFENGGGQIYAGNAARWQPHSSCQSPMRGQGRKVASYFIEWDPNPGTDWPIGLERHDTACKKYIDNYRNDTGFEYGIVKAVEDIVFESL